MRYFTLIALFILFACNEKKDKTSKKPKNEKQSVLKSESRALERLQGIWHTIGKDTIKAHWIEFDSVNSHYSIWFDGESKPDGLNYSYFVVGDSLLELKDNVTSQVSTRTIDSLLLYYLQLSYSDRDAISLTYTRKKYHEPVKPKPLPFELKSLAVDLPDTVSFKNATLYFQKTDSISMGFYYADQQFRGELTKGIDNSHRRAKILQKYTLSDSVFGSMVRTTDSTFHIALENDSLLVLDKLNKEWGHWLNFEHYFESRGLYLFRNQYSEGNGWIVINRKTGQQVHLGGMPYFRPGSKDFVTMESDLIAEYNMTGMEYFSVEEDSIFQVWHLGINNWGPQQGRWVNDSTLVVRSEYFANGEWGKMAYGFVKVTFNNTGISK